MKEELSEFLKYAYKQGKIKNVEEAFKEYPVEEEYHKGKIENILCEKKVSYNGYDIGDIVFVKMYNYKNGNIGNNHLFVIIDKNNLVVPIENIAMLISSKLNKIKYEQNELIRKDIKNGLDKDSIVKTDVIYKIRDSQILFKIGEVDIDKVEEYKKKCCNLK